VFWGFCFKALVAFLLSDWCINWVHLSSLLKQSCQPFSSSISEVVGYYVYLFISWNWGNSYKLALTCIIVKAWWMLLQVHVVYKSKSPFDLREFYHKVISIPAMELPTSSSATVSAGASCGFCQGKLLSRALISLGKCVLRGLISEHYFLHCFTKLPHAQVEEVRV
jgi:hypothetical protein